MKKRNKLLLIVVILLLIVSSANYQCQTAENDENGTRTIYLIRHGEYDQDDERDAFRGRELTPLGIAQARLLASRLKSMPVEFSSLTSSTMTRARQTALVLNQDFPDLNLIQDSLISECTPPTWREDIMADETESELDKCKENIEKAFEKYFVPSSDEKDRHDIIVCHGNVIRYFVTKVLKVDTMSWLQMSITNCSLTIVRINSNGSMKLDTFSDYGHIPENIRTFTGGENESKELVVPSK